MARLLFLRAHGDPGERGKGRVFLCAGERNHLPIPDGTLAVDPESVSTRMAGPRSDPYVGGSGAGIRRAVRARCFAPEEMWDTTPPNGNCGTMQPTATTRARANALPV